MSDQTDVEIEIIDDDSTVETDEVTTPSDLESKVESGDEVKEAPKKSGAKSNWKKLAKINKAQKAEIARLTLLKTPAQLQEEIDDEEEEDDRSDATDLRFFFLENAEAIDYKSEMQTILTKYPDMDLQDALNLAKANRPKESGSKQDFTTKSAKVKVRKKLKDLTSDEALKLTDTDQYAEWMELTGNI